MPQLRLGVFLIALTYAYNREKVNHSRTSDLLVLRRLVTIAQREIDVKFYLSVAKALHREQSRRNPVRKDGR